jgi:hypothetical protein
VAAPGAGDGRPIDGEYRFEGASNPDDESLVMALHDDLSDRLGVLITAYGPSASAAEAEVLSALAVNSAAPRPPRPHARLITSPYFRPNPFVVKLSRWAARTSQGGHRRHRRGIGVRPAP